MDQDQEKQFSNEHKSMNFLILSILLLYICTTVFINIIPHEIRNVILTILSFLIFIIIMIYSYVRLNKKLLIDSLLLCSNAEESSIDTSNLVTVLLSFLSYYLHLYIHTIVIAAIVFICIYILYILVVAQCKYPIEHWDNKWFNILCFILYKWIEWITHKLFGGRESYETDEVSNWIKYVRTTLFPHNLFMLLLKENIYMHFVPFIIGLIFTIVYSLYNLRSHDLCEDEEGNDKQKEIFINKFKQGLLMATVLVILIYVILCMKHVIISL
jgi:hypothetical protein